MAPGHAEHKPLGLRDLKSKGRGMLRLSSGSWQLTATGKIQNSNKPAAPKRKREGDSKEKAAKVQRKSRKPEQPKEAKKFLCVGLDIGTTGSAIGYAASNAAPDEITVLDHWEGHVEVKVPTRIAYASENDFKTDKWGFQVEGGMTICNWIKLLLDENTVKADFDDPLLQQAIGQGLMHLPEGKDASEVIKNFVSRVREHFLRHLNNTILETAVNNTQKRICVPVPTTWSLAAREATRQAVSKAGFGEDERDEIIVIDESEAAALDVIKSLEKSSDAERLKEGSCVMVLDCGGGTIDSVSYKITSREPLQLEEACAGEGAKIGGTSIDRALHALMQQHFGVAFSQLPVSKIGAASHFMQDFESHKRKYGSQSESKDHWLRLNMRKLDDQDENIRDRYDFVDLAAKITSADMQNMFEPVIQKMFQIIRAQVARMAKTNQSATLSIIAMCGGLSCNPHIFNRVKDFVSGFFEEDSVKVLALRQPMTAVVRGAVLAAQGCSPIVCRRSREFIGTQVHCPWDEAKHRREDRFECPVGGSRAKNQMKWIVKKGQKLKPDMKAKVQCYYVVENARAEIKKAVIDQVLYRCAEDTAPSRVDDPGVEEIGVIRVDITHIARKRRADARTGCRTYPAHIAIDVDIELTVSSNKGVLEAVAKIKRTKVGSTTITYTPAPAWEHGLVRKDEEE
ncbi:uncharacterized protein Z520_05289 [Fonsecaea multimorphosa CBS 102226]|uniref:Uncharacterized protein n=1 Tax=Fonsecaea multimorphosa CBS 102226 TaxID=1442371 RepID=A0A0D2KQ27_9EURO|nr:uncharacterized protein Z520_05289 [Fonsecaea multimorphosa CBS 102226]KIX98828.1 hypothetical protein Z520_05289 [Fonsecaea multimorphosa CBS 102226]OAL25108.1 hypothetical protein AYO22_04985 [Fonsecaea multimorphosa]